MIAALLVATSAPALQLHALPARATAACARAPAVVLVDDKARACPLIFHHCHPTA